MNTQDKQCPNITRYIPITLAQSTHAYLMLVIIANHTLMALFNIFIK